MFELPPPITTRIFARVPNDTAAGPIDPEWTAGQLAIAPAHGVLEGPSFDLDGNLYCVDVPRGCIHRIAPDASVELFIQYDGWPCGLKIHRDGTIFVADMKHGLMKLDPKTRRIEPVVTRYKLERFKGINDLFFARNGDIYFTDQGTTGLHDATGRLFRLSASGELTCLLDNIPSPNGLVMNADETVIYLAVTRGNCIWRVPLLRNGMPSKVGLFIQMTGGWGPDGIALDTKGRLVVTHVGLGIVWLFDPSGEPVYRIKACEGTHVTNVAYGGPDGATLYITESHSSTVQVVELDAPGKPMYSHH
nr:MULTISPECIES: SMP-30/gluconolactonase/LRE family protein [unclassified Variovorax]